MTHDDGDPLLSNFISGLGGLLLERKEASWSPTGSGAASTLTTIVMPTTITVNSTVVQTTFVTITTHVARSTTTACAQYGPTTCGSDPNSTQGIDQHTALPKIVTRSSPAATALSHTSDGSKHPQTTSAAATSSKGGSMSHAQRHAVIGGLSGAIAGLVLIGLLLALFFRRRQKRDTESIAGSENGLREVISRNWSQLTKRTTPPMSRGNVEVAPMPPMSRQSSAGDFNGSLLRVSMGQWPRPFAQNESFRESVGPSRLMVMNPDDPSRSASPAPRGSTESGGTYLRRQRSAITAAVFGGSHSRTSSNAPSRQRSLKVPSIKVDSLSSSERGPRHPPTPSFRSYPSVTSLQTVQHQPPEDPFLTPPEGSVEERQPRLQRPSLATIQSAAGAAGRSLSSLGHALNPFRSRSNTVEDEPQPSLRSSSTTFSSNGDPFRLDRRSVPDTSVVMEETMPTEMERAHIPPWRLYDGT